MPVTSRARCPAFKPDGRAAETAVAAIAELLHACGLTRAPSNSSVGPVGRFALCLLLAGGACGEQNIRAIQRLPAPTPVGSVPSAGAGGAPDAPDLPASGSPSELPVTHDRGRVQVRDGNLLTDKGTRLRGVTFGLDGTAPDFHFEQAFIAQLSAETGLNAFHVYADNSGEAVGTHAAQVDELVEATSSASMYLILGIGGGKAGGSFDLQKIRAFWSFYAPRYAARTHVLYEIQNIPDTGCNVAYRPETLAMEKDVYALIRGIAPSTHVALFSFVSQPTGPALTAALDAVEGSVDWSKASVAFHTQPCAGQDNLSALASVARARNIAVFGSEMPFVSSFQGTAELETQRLGWFNFEWLVRNRDLAAFRDAHSAAGISWCPDFGTWPEDSQTCSTP